MNKKLIGIIFGMRIEVEGREVLLVLEVIRPPQLPINTRAEEITKPTVEEITKPIDQLLKIQKQCPVVFVTQQSEGFLSVLAPPEWKEAIESRKIHASKLTNIPIFYDEFEQSPKRG